MELSPQHEAFFKDLNAVCKKHQAYVMIDGDRFLVQINGAPDVDGLFLIEISDGQFMMTPFLVEEQEMIIIEDF